MLNRYIQHLNIGSNSEYTLYNILHSPGFLTAKKRWLRADDGVIKNPHNAAQCYTDGFQFYLINIYIYYKHQYRGKFNKLQHDSFHRNLAKILVLLLLLNITGCLCNTG